MSSHLKNVQQMFFLVTCFFSYIINVDYVNLVITYVFLSYLCVDWMAIDIYCFDFI